jgi:hypothetical protein
MGLLRRAIAVSLGGGLPRRIRGGWSYGGGKAQREGGAKTTLMPSRSPTLERAAHPQRPLSLSSVQERRSGFVSYRSRRTCRLL